MSIARDRGIKQLYAIMAPENIRMAKVFQTIEIKPKVVESGNEVEYFFVLDS